MRHCPTEAIRIRDGKAVISEDLCVDCGVCISVCPSGAIMPVNDSPDLARFRYKVALPASVFYSQFDPMIHPYAIHLAFKKIGFDEVVDISRAAAVLARTLVKYMKQYKGRLPVISSHCPAMLRLVQVKYPDLVELIAPIDVPSEVAAREVKMNYSARLGLKPEEIGVIQIVPCPAKVVSINQPAEKAKSWIDGAVSVRDAYAALIPQIPAIRQSFDQSQVPQDFNFSVGWGSLGGVTRSVQMDSWLAVSGLDHVMKIFDDIENSRLRNVEFVEALCCMLGCLGGPFNVENPYITRTNNFRQRAKYESPIPIDDNDIEEKLATRYYFMENDLLPRPTRYFDTDLETSLKRIKESEKLYQKLRQIDCGCCGAPTCMAFAEDCVRGEAKLTDCIFLGQGPG